MGSVKRFNFKKLIQLNKAEYFFETGTWRGDGLAYAANYPFKKLYSSEIIESVANKAKERFQKNPNIEIITSNSTDALKQYVSKINGNCIFWLDAHFPGAEEGLKDYNEIEDESVKLPLETELEIISSRAKKYNDIILVDDLRIYEEANYKNGNLPNHVLPPKIRNTNFVNTLYQETHTIIKSLQDEGYLLLIPRKIKKAGGLKNFLYNMENKMLGKVY